MNDAKAFKATYVGAGRPAIGRGQVRYIFEVPAHMEMQALRILGGSIPKSGEERWFAIVELNPETRKGVSDGVSLDKTQTGDPSLAPAPPRAARGHSIDPFARSVIITSESEPFKKWAVDWGLAPYEEIGKWVKARCGVESRKHITRGSRAEQMWNLIESAFRLDVYPQGISQ